MVLEKSHSLMRFYNLIVEQPQSSIVMSTTTAHLIVTIGRQLIATNPSNLPCFLHQPTYTRIIPNSTLFLEYDLLRYLHGTLPCLIEQITTTPLLDYIHWYHGNKLTLHVILNFVT